jgi:hypothetical protein
MSPESRSAGAADEHAISPESRSAGAANGEAISRIKICGAADEHAISSESRSAGAATRTRYLPIQDRARPPVHRQPRTAEPPAVPARLTPLRRRRPFRAIPADSVQPAYPWRPPPSDPNIQRPIQPPASQAHHPKHTRGPACTPAPARYRPPNA